MKPRIKKVPYWCFQNMNNNPFYTWFCLSKKSDEWGYGGKTPKQAYENWVNANASR